MSYELRIHVPESVPDSVRKDLINQLTREYGGTATYEYRGTWVNDNGAVINESGTVVECHLSGVNESARAGWVRRWYHSYLKQKTDESAIMTDVRETNAVIR